MASKALRSCRWFLAGAFASCFWACPAMWIVQVMEELFEGYKFPAFDFGAAFANGGKLGFGGGPFGKTAFKVLAPGFAQKLASGAVLFLLDFGHLLGHGWRQGDCQGGGGSHGINSLSVTCCDFSRVVPGISRQGQGPVHACPWRGIIPSERLSSAGGRTRPRLGRLARIGDPRRTIPTTRPRENSRLRVARPTGLQRR